GRLTESFDILNSSSRTQIQLINNQQTVLNRWIFELEPKTTGTLAIPALSIGPQLKTNPLTLTVLPAPQLDEAAKDIFIEVSAEPRNPYVQEQVRYSERIFLAAPLADDTLRRDGTLQDALLQPLGEMKRYVAERDGRNYQVFERNYALIPEKSGELTLPSLTLRGRVGNRQPGQQSLSRGRRIQINSEPITLQVRPRPADYGANAGDNTDA
ncbi:MAG: BatD family protein, partial [Candidatus Competibacteraceae bacterium]|nr:BatD family protein [Candidatus Competibacteraceae bacterium]